MITSKKQLQTYMNRALPYIIADRGKENILEAKITINKDTNGYYEIHLSLLYNDYLYKGDCNLCDTYYKATTLNQAYDHAVRCLMGMSSEFYDERAVRREIEGEFKYLNCPLCCKRRRVSSNGCFICNGRKAEKNGTLCSV